MSAQNFRRWTACVLVTLSGAAVLAPAVAQEVTPAQVQSGKYQAYQAWLNQPFSAAAQTDSLSGYAEKCNRATGITVPRFSCRSGVEVPGQGNLPEDSALNIKCDRPNVLNNACDPGSKFQVLPGRSADAVAVAHCRKNGLSDRWRAIQ